MSPTRRYKPRSAAAASKKAPSKAASKGTEGEVSANRGQLRISSAKTPLSEQSGNKNRSDGRGRASCEGRGVEKPVTAGETAGEAAGGGINFQDFFKATASQQGSSSGANTEQGSWDDVKNAEMRKTSLQSLLPDIPPRFEIAKVAENQCKSASSKKSCRTYQQQPSKEQVPIHSQSKEDNLGGLQGILEDRDLEVGHSRHEASESSGHVEDCQSVNGECFPSSPMKKREDARAIALRRLRHRRQSILRVLKGVESAIDQVENADIRVSSTHQLQMLASSGPVEISEGSSMQLKSDVVGASSSMESAITDNVQGAPSKDFHAQVDGHQEVECRSVETGGAGEEKESQMSLLQSARIKAQPRLEKGALDGMDDKFKGLEAQLYQLKVRKRESTDGGNPPVKPTDPGPSELPADSTQHFRPPRPSPTAHAASSDPSKPTATKLTATKPIPGRVASATRAAAIHRLRARTQSFTHSRTDASSCNKKPTKDCLPTHLPRKDRGNVRQPVIPRVVVSRGARREGTASSRGTASRPARDFEVALSPRRRAVKRLSPRRQAPSAFGMPILQASKRTQSANGARKKLDVVMPVMMG